MAKFRNGFVTNSSSSSFIIALDKLPTSVEEVKKLLFKDGEDCYPAIYSNEVFSLDEVAERVFNEFQEAKPNDAEQIKDAMGGWWEDMPDFYHNYTKDLKFDSKEYKAASDRAWKDQDAWYAKKYEEYMKTNKGKKVVCLSFSDNDGPLNASIEHGDLLNHLKPMKISHH